MNGQQNKIEKEKSRQREINAAVRAYRASAKALLASPAGEPMKKARADCAKKRAVLDRLVGKSHGEQLALKATLGLTAKR